ncbi:uncharacterized protein K489DRAFT_65779 [Dissoconium aciculare CBS 342.82]|uniref:Uncharacterized protein n=1 Tax=Dissoconium aciculare CBS 342.82 TaxID=1314786 RepID=A0A6J3LUR3_9PEZI|nr:uncharacterized protein K489DRAFT_65779 [Dissoconium aciculare CBS 342.82]KAF1819403.1 hypothetical protein K489DRAFT_65779 [Dissoconium aciculare CBS 342.82]
MRATRPALIMIATLFSIVVIGESSTEPTRALPMSPKFSLLIRPTCMNALIDIPIVARGSIAGEFGTSTNIIQDSTYIQRENFPCERQHPGRARLGHLDTDKKSFGEWDWTCVCLRDPREQQPGRHGTCTHTHTTHSLFPTTHDHELLLAGDDPASRPEVEMRHLKQSVPVRAILFPSGRALHHFHGFSNHSLFSVQFDGHVTPVTSPAMRIHCESA